MVGVRERKFFLLISLRTDWRKWKNFGSFFWNVTWKSKAPFLSGPEDNKNDFTFRDLELIKKDCKAISCFLKKMKFEQWVGHLKNIIDSLPIFEKFGRSKLVLIDHFGNFYWICPKSHLLRIFFCQQLKKKFEKLLFDSLGSWSEK